MHVTASAAAAVLDAANATYGVMLRCLIAVYEVLLGEDRRRKALLGAAIASMKALTALACKLTQLPAKEGEATPCAGVSFAMLRSIEGFVANSGSAHLVAERLRHIVSRVTDLELTGIESPITSMTDAAAELDKKSSAAVEKVAN